MFKPKKDFEWNLLGIYYGYKPGKFSGYFDFLKKNLDKDGDLDVYLLNNSYRLLHFFSKR